MKVNKELITIGDVKIGPGEERTINASLSKLPTRTSIEIPVLVTRSKEPGPVLFLMGGMHGDEINGIEIVRRIISKGLHRVERGSTICVPLLNIYGFINLTREVPGGKDINRAFPGSRTGSLASQIAYQLRREIIPNIDYGIDFHTGGNKINNFPQIRTKIEGMPQNLAIAQAFATRFVINSPMREKSFRKEAAKHGKPILLYEAGESLSLRASAIKEGVNGTLRVMKFLGMIDQAPEKVYEPVVLSKSSWLRARSSGIHYSYTQIGTEVRKGEKIGVITGPFADFEIQVVSRFNGYIIAINNNPVVSRGDPLYHIGIVGN